MARDQLVATARAAGDLAELARAGGHRVVCVALDVTDEAAAARAVTTAVERFGGLDVVVNNAGYGNVAPIEDTTVDSFRQQIETNLFGVEGFTEILATEMAPFGVKVTIVEPGGFCTDFAGASTQIAEGNPAYAETVGKTAAMQRAYSGKQPGDPDRAARAILDLVAAPAPPLRLVLGKDAYARAERTDESRLAELPAWRELSESTDFPTG